ncbi:MAG: DUF1275 domain-containing protein [Oscillospiraceae bacterium]|nr:DUF1275 domain-containing protein [Oscillospiraceae bacterium]
MDSSQEPRYLECERWWTFALLMTVGGYLGAFTYNLRGGVFCNAQTANIVLFAIALGKGAFAQAFYYVIPMGAYLAGAMLSEALPLKLRRAGLIRWDTALVGLELLAVLALGFLPEQAPFQITQVSVNFICSMQYNTFRQAQGVPMATTFCTNHVRQTGVHLTKWLRSRHPEDGARCLAHIGMLLAFAAGGVVCTMLCPRFLGRSIWGAGILLAVVFADLLYADLCKERGLLFRKPAGH